MIKKNPKYSKRINYDALKDLFVEGGGPPSFAANMGLNDDKDDAELYSIGDDKSDDDGLANMVIIEEEPAQLGAGLPQVKGPIPGDNGDGDGDLDADADADEGSDDDKGDDLGWEYEQEV